MSPARDVVERLVIARRRVAHDAVTAMLASLASERTAGDFLDLGAAADRATSQMRRRTISTRSATR